MVEPPEWPDVVAVIPARNEAGVIARTLGGVAAQDYPGRFRILLVDDNSDDGTGEIARSLASPRITVIAGRPLAPGWTGKLWALSQGIDAAGSSRYLWLTDADIEHDPDTLRQLVGIAHGGSRRLVSFMAHLHCRSWAERALIPAFVWFFMMLYPFNWINRRSPVSGAAGGCVLVERAALEDAGGITAIRGALIDDCALGTLIKRQGPIWVGLTHRSRSIRPYAALGEIEAMIARSAYAQLRYSPIMLAGTLVGLALMFVVPIGLAVFARGAAEGLAVATLVVMVLAYQPIMRFYRRSPLWGLALPLVGLFYGWCTLASAWRHGRGRGGMWKGRAQALTRLETPGQ
jgi:hopene-associated glycosyltransferase HpnB